MSVEVLPLGVRCNLKCGTPTATYCYQEPIRIAGNEGHPKYDMEAMMAALLKENYAFTIFGGESLLVPKKDLEKLFAFGQKTFGERAKKAGHSVNSIQTNATLMDEDHFALFKKYEVSVGVSMDGPDELNDARWAGSEEATREATEHSQWALEELLKRQISASLIVTLHRFNASAERLPRLIQWLQDLTTKGLRSVNLHLLEVDMPGVREQLVLTSAENVTALLACGRLMQTSPIKVAPLTEMVKLLRGEDHTNCTWNGCDPYTTAAVHGVDGQGNRGNCGRTCKDGPMWLKADTPGYERYLSLYFTPMDKGGCSGCRFFYACKGNCPGEGEHGDWRGKTEHCETLMRVFEKLEAEIISGGALPISLSPKRALAETNYLQAWQQGRNISLSEAIKPAVAQQAANTPHRDTPHLDHDDVVKPIVTHIDHDDNGGVSWKL